MRNISRIEHLVSVNTTIDTSRYSGVLEEIISGSPAMPLASLNLIHAHSSTRYGISVSAPARLNIDFANAHDEILKLRLAGAGGAEEEALFTYTGQVNDIAGLDIVTSGKNHIDINATANTRLIEISGSGNNYLTFGDDGFGRPSIASNGLVIDGRSVTGDSVYFVGSHYANDMTLRGSTADGIKTYLGLRIIGEKEICSLTDVQGLVLQKGSTGTLDLSGNTEIKYLELQTSGTRPGEEHAVATLQGAAALQSVTYVGGGGSGDQRFPGLRVTGESSWPGAADRLEISMTNRGTALLPASSLEFADQIVLNGVGFVSMNLAGAIGSKGQAVLPGLGASSMTTLMIANPSTGFSDFGVIDTNASLKLFDATGVTGPFAVQFGAGSFASDVVLLTSTADARILINSGQASQTVHLSMGDGNNQVDAQKLQSGLTVQAGQGNNTLRLGDGVNQVMVGNGNNVITTGDADDVIGFGSGQNQVSVGLGTDTFRVMAENGGELEKISAIEIADVGPSDDLIEFQYVGSSSQAARLSGSASVVDFLNQVNQRIADPEIAAHGPGLYSEVISGPGGTWTYLYENTGVPGHNVVLQVSGSREPELAAATVAIR